MLKVFDPETARQTILKRVPLDEMPVPPSVQERTNQVFGEPLTPAQAVDRILADVRKRGDAALRHWAMQLDGRLPKRFVISRKEIQSALKKLSEKRRNALELAADRIRRFHQAQPVSSWVTQDLGGTLGQFMRPIQRAGIYIPAGSAPLPSSVLMSAIPAQVAGVPEIVLVAPPQGDNGKVASIILATAALLDIEEIYPIGGAQAIAALAYGTESIRPVDKIFGPGNLFVSLAKRRVFGVVGIDSLAGPTETMIIADDSARPDWVAADLLAQAEHDVLASAILLTPCGELIDNVREAIARQLEQRQRSQIINISLDNRGGAILTDNLEEAVQLANEYAPEHLCLVVSDPWRLAEKVMTAGGIFLGEHSFEVLGDYVAGPSHIMPTGGSARFNSPLNVLDFIHITSLVALNPETARKIAPEATILALAENLDAHAFSAQVRQ